MEDKSSPLIRAKPPSFARQLWIVLGTFAALLAFYVAVIHPWLMNWGTTGAEQSMALPGDEAVASQETYFTRAITIDAPSDKVWPWLLQMGQNRAGFYSNDWLENLIAADIHNADVIHPEWQHRQLGDVVPLVPPGYLGGLAGSAIAGRPGSAFGPHIRLLQRGRAIADTPERFILVPIDDHTTRLLVRESISANTPGGGVVGVVAGRLVWDPMHFVMVQRMLRGIKERAEGQPLVLPVLQVSARIGWIVAGLALLALFLSRRQGAFLLLIPLSASISALAFAGDPNAALAGFLAVGITIAGALVFGRSWWTAYLLLAAGVLLVLVLSPDAYAVFGVLFDLIVAAAFLAVLRSELGHATTGPPAHVSRPKTA